MTPKEKALYLWNKIYVSKISTNSFRCEETKLCALIAVDEIIKSHEMAVCCEFMVLDFWREVRKEIEKL